MRRRVVIALAFCALLGCSTTSHGYSGGTEAAFLETCTVHQTQPGPICGCIYEEITKRIPFDRYVELDKQMQKDEKFVPDELVHIAADCASRVNTTTSSNSESSGTSNSSS